MAWLTFHVTGEERLFPITQDIVTIGRSPANTIVIDDRSSSRKHCMIKREGGEYVILDLGSTNGTLLNGARSERSRLSPGDKITIGQTEFVFQI